MRTLTFEKCQKSDLRVVKSLPCQKSILFYDVEKGKKWKKEMKIDLDLGLDWFEVQWVLFWGSLKWFTVERLVLWGIVLL